MRIVAALLIAAVATASTAEAAPKSELVDEHWTQSGSGSIGHQAWDAFLGRWATASPDGINRVAYSKVDAGGQAELAAYLEHLQAADPTALSRAEQFAYWVNLYNAATVALILNEQPVDSIRDIGGGLFARGPWDDDAVTVVGRTLSLNDIEHGILRPIWNDPRIHYVVNCASIGCPNLGLKSFPVTDAEATLDAAAQAYVNHPRAARIEDGKLIVSSIYAWYAEDFGGDDAGIISHLKAHAQPDLKLALKEISGIARDEYNWSLNEAP